MAISTWRSVLLTATAALAVSCGSPPTPPSVPEPIGPSSAESPAAEPALTAYSAFWAVVDSALGAPGSQDWLPELQTVATGQALDTARADVANYADLPAHTAGVVSRAPVVERSTADRVAIVDCIDLGDSRLVSDTSGEVLDDLTNRVQRYRFRAEVTADASGRWLVDRTEPALDEPC